MSGLTSARHLHIGSRDTRNATNDRDDSAIIRRVI